MAIIEVWMIASRRDNSIPSLQIYPADVYEIH